MQTQRNELAKQVNDIFENRLRQYDFDQACAAVVALIHARDFTTGAPLFSEKEPPFRNPLPPVIEKRIVPIESLAPTCPQSPSGFHCGDHRYRLEPLYHELRCCWCDATVEVKIRQIHVRTEGHGPKSGYDEERFEMPVGWEEVV